MKRLGIFLLMLGLSGCSLFRIPLFGGPPSVVDVSPAPGADNVGVGAQVNADLSLPNGGVSLTTLTENSVTLTDTTTGQAVPASVSVDNDAQTLTLAPTGSLEFSTEYSFEVSSSVEDESGTAFTPYSSTFTTVSEDVPSVTGSRPSDGERNVPVTTSIATDLNAPNGGVAPGSITDSSVYLTNLETGARVSGGLGTSGGNDTITFTPSQPLDVSTTYQFDVTSAVTDNEGTPFVPYTMQFTTAETGGGGCGENCNITQTFQQTSLDERHSSLAVGPDRQLYGATADGRILRYPISGDGSLGAPETLTSLQSANGGPRLTVGLTFDPAATADNLIVWVTHTELGSFEGGEGGINPGVDAPWAGKLTRLSGPNLETVQDYVIGLPRSSKDHVTNSVAFNPAEPGVVYFIQGSNTAMGAPDGAWNYQEERFLSGAVLRLDTNLIGGSLPLDVQTEDGGTYDPLAAGAPLTVYASGTRNSYDLVWHSNGNLYVPANGSASGGIVPRYDPLPGTCEQRIDGQPYTGPVLASPDDVPGAEYLSDQTDGWRVPQTLSDYLFKIEEGGYYGTPNPKRCEWILNGGGAATDSTNIEIYPSSVEADPNYRGPAYDYGQNISPNGSIEYRGSIFGEFQGMLLTTRYSSGDDVVALELDSSGNAVGEATPITSGKFSDPIDIAEDPQTGLLYVSSYDQTGQEQNGPAGITLLSPQ